MGLRGPAPKPTAMRIAEGNPSRRPLNSREPQPNRVAPKCPSHLDKEAKREWRRLVPILLRMRVLTEADGYALANLCQAFSTMVRAQKKLNESGLLIRTPNGFAQQSPLLSVVNTCMQTITQLSREFGLTPASRTRIQAAEDEKFNVVEWMTQ